MNRTLARSLGTLASGALLAAVGSVVAVTGGGTAAGAVAPGGSSVRIDLGHPGNTIADDFLGLSYEKSVLAEQDIQPSQGNFVQLLKTLSSTGHLRFGGNLMDNTTWWQPGNKPVPPFATAIVRPEGIDRLDAVSRASGWNVEMGFNLKNYDQDAVAAEIAYDSAKLGPRLIGAACGNEPDLYPNYSYATYKPRWEACVNTIGNRAKILGPNDAEIISTPFLDDEASRLLFATAHYYPLTRCNGGVPTIPNLLSAGTVGAETLRFSADVVASAQHGLKFRMDETNSASCGGSAGTSDVYAGSLWALDYALLGAQTGVVGMNLHGGLLTSPCTGNYSPLCSLNAADQASRTYTANPSYYGMLAFQQVGAGTMYPVGITGPTNVRAYAVRNPGGDLKVVLIQKDAPGGTPVDVQLSGITGSGPGRAVSLSAPSLSSDRTAITLGGAQVGRDGRFGTPTTTAVPARDGGYGVSLPTGSAMIITVPGATAAPLPADEVNGQRIVNTGGNRCLDISGYRNLDGIPTQLYDCAGGWNQQWRFVDGALVNPFTNRCLDVSGGRVTAGTAVQLWTCLGNGAQKWELRADGSLVNTNSNKCLDTVGGSVANNAKMQISDCNGSPGQRFRAVTEPTPTTPPTTPTTPPTTPTTPPTTPTTPPTTVPTGAVNVVGVASKRCLTATSTADFAPAVISDCGTSALQRWTVGNGVVRNAGSNRCLSIADNKTANGSAVRQYTCNGSPGQAWVRQANGALQNPASKRCLDVAKQATANNSPLQIWDCAGNSATNQLWTYPAPAAAAR